MPATNSTNSTRKLDSSALDSWEAGSRGAWIQSAGIFEHGTAVQGRQMS